MHQPSAVQAREFFDRFLVYSDSFSRGMQSLGNEGIEILCNAEHIQKAWARENGFEYSEDGWIQEIIRAQIAELKPDVIYIQGISRDPQSFLPEGTFRAENPFVKLVVAYSGFPHDIDRFDGVDVVISGAPQLVSYYAKRGLDSHLVYHGFDDAVLDHLDPSYSPENKGPNGYEFAFSGLSGVGFRDGHKGRYWDLIRLILDTGLEAWVYDRLEYLTEENRLPADSVKQLSKAMQGAQGRVEPERIVVMLREILSEQFGSDDPRIPLSELFPDRCHPPAFGLDMFEVLRRSKIAFNRHTDALGEAAFGNIRVFEATGVGSCLVTDFADNGHDLFEPDTEIVTYTCVEECIEKVKYLLENDSERLEIAEAGRQRTLNNHTMRHRCEQIHEFIENAIH